MAGDLERLSEHYRRQAQAAPPGATRDLWVALADEIDAYLVGGHDDERAVTDDDTGTEPLW